MPALGPRHHRVRRLRELIRDPQRAPSRGRVRRRGPADARRRARPRRRAREFVRRDPVPSAPSRRWSRGCATSDVPIEELKEGVLERIGDTRDAAAGPRRGGPMTRPDLDDARRGRSRGRRGDGARPGQRRHDRAQRGGGRGGGSSVLRQFGGSVRPEGGAIVGRSDVRNPGRGGGRPGEGARRARPARTAPPRAPSRPAASTSTDVDLTGPVALVLGNEAHGIPPTLEPTPRRAGHASRSSRRPSRSTSAMAGTVLALRGGPAAASGVVNLAEAQQLLERGAVRSGGRRPKPRPGSATSSPSWSAGTSGEGRRRRW